MHAVKRAGQIDAHHIVPGVGGQHIEVALRRIGAGTVDQNVDAAVLRQDAVRRRFDCMFVGHIQWQGLGTAQRLQAAQSAFIGGGVATGDDHMRTGLHQGHGACQTNAAAAARDPSHLALKLFAHAAVSLLCRNGIQSCLRAATCRQVKSAGIHAPEWA